jgi:hypothetical protein
MFKHPLFRAKKTASGVSWENSIYYLWWEFLRRHDGYKHTCKNGGKGKYAKLYEDFADVHGGSFKDWWTKAARGVRLFAEPVMPNGIEAIGFDDIERVRAL